MMDSSDSFTNLEFPIYDFFSQTFVMFSFSTGKQKKETCFGPIRNLLFFSTAQSEKNSWKKLVKQIGENI